MKKHMFLLITYILSTNLVTAMEESALDEEKSSLTPSPIFQMSPHLETEKQLQTIQEQVYILPPIPSPPPIKSGFYDRLDADRMKDKETKRAEATKYFQEKGNLYNFFLEQLATSYLHKEYRSNPHQQNSVKFIKKFFESKLDTLHDKAINFEAHLDIQQKADKKHEEAFNTTFKTEAIGTYNGKLKEQPENQAVYAKKKYLEWKYIHKSLQQFPLSKTTPNPIVQQAIEKYILDFLKPLKSVHIIDPRKFERLEVKSTLGTPSVYKSEVLKLISPLCLETILPLDHILSLNNMISDEYSLPSYSKKHYLKWKNRLGKKQKLDCIEELYTKLNLENSKKSSTEN